MRGGNRFAVKPQEVVVKTKHIFHFHFHFLFHMASIIILSYYQEDFITPCTGFHPLTALGFPSSNHIFHSTNTRSHQCFNVQFHRKDDHLTMFCIIDPLFYYLIRSTQFHIIDPLFHHSFV